MKLNKLWKSSKIFKVVIIVLGLAIIGSIFGSNEEVKNEEKQIKEDKIKLKNNEVKDKQSNYEETKLDIIYDKDKTINKFLNRYNEIYTDSKIEKKDVQILHHHGQDHPDQVSVLNRDLEITLTNGVSEFSVFLKRGNNDLNKDINYKFKDAFTRSIKTLNSEISDDNIEKYWKDLLETNIFEGDNISGNSMKEIDDNNIEYIKIEGEFK